MTHRPAVPDPGTAIDPRVEPSGVGCVECLAAEPVSWWFHLRRCATCGHIGCCDASPRQHATGHYRNTGHSIIRSFEPGEHWFYDYATGRTFTGPELAGAAARPVGQPPPGPEGAVPKDWRSRLRS
jgi:hypothetical protein